jgi:hypothetical protein
LGDSFTIMDATSEQSLPHGVASTRIPAWVLPHTPPEIRNRMRPDLLIFQGLSSSNPLIPTAADSIACLSPSALTSLQAGVVVHLLELGFTSHDMDTLCNKEQQHTLLVNHLQTAGWRLSLADVTYRPPLPPLRPSLVPLGRFTRTPDGRLIARFLRRAGRDPQVPLFLVPENNSDIAPAVPLLSPTPTATHAAPLAPPPHLPYLPTAHFHHPADIPSLTPSPITLPMRPRRRRPRYSSNDCYPAPLSGLAGHGLGGGSGGGGTSGTLLLPTAWGAPAYGDPALLHLSRYVHILLLGTDGSLFLPLDTLLTDVLRIPDAELFPLLHRLNAHSVALTHAIIRRRRALDFDPSSVRIPFDFDPP